jgi:hypothetical protein
LISAATDRGWSIALQPWRKSHGQQGARSSPGTLIGIGFELEPTVLSIRWMMDPKQSVSSKSVIERMCIEVLANGAVKLPAPLALPAAEPCAPHGLAAPPSQRQSAPQLTAGVSRPGADPERVGR